MADEVSEQSNAQKLVQEIPSNHEDSSKFFSHFLYKAAIVIVFCALLPFFPAQAPEFIGQTIHARSWELLQLIFVGVAVSYGLFSQKNNESEKNHASKFDNAQSYISKFLQDSSVFYDESENPTVIDENKFQTWSSQYYMRQPVVVVAKENSVVEQQKGSSSEIGQKPLLLPVRSLKQQVLDPNEEGLVDYLGKEKGNFNMSNSKRFTSNSSKLGNKELQVLVSRKMEDSVEESVALRSPVPWKSRSGRFEMKENKDGLSEFSTLVENSDLNRLEPKPYNLNLSLKKLSPSPSISSPRKLSPLTSLTFDSQNNSGDVVRKKNFSSPPPVPPPPPPIRKPMLVKSNSTMMNDQISRDKVLRRSVRSVPVDRLSLYGTEDQSRRPNTGQELKGKSVRTFRSIESIIGAEKKTTEFETNFIENKGYTDTRVKEHNPDSAQLTHLKFPSVDKNKFDQNMFTEPTCEESDAESEDSYFGGKEEADVPNIHNDVAPDVDKKADEFIAKFREQIRLRE